MPAVNKAEKLDDLVRSVEDLLNRLPDSMDPAITALRDKVDDGIFQAWTAISNRAKAQRLGANGAPLKVAAFFGAAILLACAAGLLANRYFEPRRRAG